MAVHDSPAKHPEDKRTPSPAGIPVMSRFRHARRTAGIHFKEDISEAVKNLFTRLGEIEERYGELMRDAGHMDTYDARYEATEKAEATVQEKFPRQSARSGKRRSWNFRCSGKTVAMEKTEATEAQPSSGEMRFKGGRVN